MENKYHLHEDFVTCPHCDHVINDDEEMYHSGMWDSDNMEDGAHWDMKCPSCSETIFIESYTAYFYSSYQNEDDRT